MYDIKIALIFQQSYNTNLKMSLFVPRAIVSEPWVNLLGKHDKGFLLNHHMGKMGYRYTVYWKDDSLK